MLKVRFSDDTYKGKPSPKPTRIDFKDREENGGQQYTEKIMKKIPNLDEVLIVLSYKELEMKLTGIDENDLDDTEENRDATKALDRKKKTPFKDDEDEEPVRKKKTVEAEKEPVKKAKTPKKPISPTWDELQEMEIEELVEVADTNDIDISDCNEDEEEIKGYLAEQLEIEKPEKRASKRNKPEPEPEKKAKKKPEPDDDDEDNEKPEATEIRIGSMVQHAKFGECEIVALNRKELTATLCDEDGERYVGIPFHKFNVISFGKPGEPGKHTKTETEERRKPAKEYVKPAGKSKCPNGHIFGKDFEKFPKDCDACPLWDDCSDE
jgi:hypothetical protein